VKGVTLLPSEKGEEPATGKIEGKYLVGRNDDSHTHPGIFGVIYVWSAYRHQAMAATRLTILTRATTA
jgi:hypothetical protein